MEFTPGLTEEDTPPPDPICGNTKRVMSKLLGEREAEWAAVTKSAPLNLLDLPVDVLKVIIREVSRCILLLGVAKVFPKVTHTNDLTSLALSHSALHALAIPQIYSRFDIVWPDGHTTTDNRTGVDALTYGLATLVMARDVFGEASNQKYSHHHIHRCSQCGRLDQCPHPARPASRWQKTRRGNDFAQYTRKFSLGNGPADWVQEYLITKEGGKMLGTLVALAVGRMRNLETFIWDMPTGVLRDVWLALGSLADREDGHESRLERVWVRWHDNSEASSPPGNPTLIPHNSQSGNPLAPTSLPGSLFQIPPYPRVEFPTFSILSPLKSLSVLDIDELPYVQEMSILIERSFLRLRELRVGLAQHAQYDTWASLPEDKIHVGPPTTDNASSSPGGLLGTLLGGLNETSSVNSMVDSIETTNEDARTTNETRPLQTTSSQSIGIPSKGLEFASKVQETHDPSIFQNISTIKEALENSSIPVVNFDVKMQELTDSLASQSILDSSKRDCNAESSRKPSLSPLKLRLDVLELERVSLSIPVLSRSIEWTSLTSLTILGCRQHEQLWKELRKKFSPRPEFGMPSTSPKTSLKSPRTPSTPRFAFPLQDYPLKLKRLHTDCVSNSLIAFIRDSLAPDSLEWLFLQENKMYPSNVTIDQIYRGPLRRHRASLRKLLIESGDRTDDNGAVAAGGGGPSSRNRRWTLNREVLTFILSGRMSCLRELAVAIDYKDWHFFLQRLPCIPHLRSLHIPHISEHVHGRNLDSRELALQIVDVVALRPELELCYLGIQTKCFEILEYAAGHKPSGSDLASASHGSGINGGGSDDDSDDADGAHQHQHPSSDHGGIGEDGGSEIGSAREEGDSDGDDEERSENGRYTRSKMAKVFKLREILFYDDKVSIFRARHGRL